MTMKEMDDALFRLWLRDPEIAFADLKTLELRYRALYGESPTVLAR